MISGERKKFELRSARNPMLVSGMSNTVIVYEDDVPKFCFITFDESFIDLAGKKLSRGVSASDLAHVQVSLDSSTWTVSVKYVEGHEEKVLWVTDTRPTWLKQLKTIRHTNESTTHTARRATTSERTRASNTSTA